MKLIHTSDWHLGHTLYGRRRHHEFRLFFDWLIEQINRHEVDALIVAGDIFDTIAPSNTAQRLYYDFLHRASATTCRHIVVTGGNHDSPSLLNAPRDLLSHLNVHVVGSMTESVEDEVLVLDDRNTQPGLIVCAVPYLRDRDIRRSEAGESSEAKAKNLVEGIRSHYHDVCRAAIARREQLSDDPNLPIAATGHLFTVGGKTSEGDGVRELYVGNLCRIDDQTFPGEIDYLALGHLHVPQRVAGRDDRRYCGSPIPMSFGEAPQQKQVLLVEFVERKTPIGENLTNSETEGNGSHAPQVTTLPVPRFQRLETVRSDLDTIRERIETLRCELESPEVTDINRTIWLEIVYDGTEIVGDLQQQIDEMIGDAIGQLLPLSVKNMQVYQQAICEQGEGESLDELDALDVFQRCLDAKNVPEQQRDELMDLFQQVVSELHERDVNAD